MNKKETSRGETPGESKKLRLTRRPVARLTDEQMQDAAGGHPHDCPTQANTCPGTCNGNYTCAGYDTCGGDTCQYTCPEGCRPEPSADSWHSYCPGGC